MRSIATLQRYIEANRKQLATPWVQALPNPMYRNELKQEIQEYKKEIAQMRARRFVRRINTKGAAITKKRIQNQLKQMR
jgi:hypothetical protein